MGEPDDEATVTKMLDRVAARFPTVTRARVAAIVQVEQEKLSGGRIRDYIPVLVERAAIERLRQEAVAAPVLSSDAGTATRVPPPDADHLDPMERDRRSQVTGPMLGDLGGPLSQRDVEELRFRRPAPGSTAASQDQKEARTRGNRAAHAAGSCPAR